jgi:hypothetical protein
MNVLLHEQAEVARVPLSAVRDLRIVNGSRRTWSEGMLFGLGLGAFAGLVLGTGCGGGEIQICSASEAAAAMALAGAVIGTAIGALKTDRWQPVEPGALEVAVRPVRGGAGVSLAFGLPGR